VGFGLRVRDLVLPLRASFFALLWVEAGRPTHLIEKEAKKDEPEPKALACYGMYLPELQETWIRFVDGRPVSAITARFLGYCCDKLAAAGKEALLLIWDNASSGIKAER
jgi:hypothetical protein